LTPDGPGFTVDGYNVNWQGWDFHVRADAHTSININTAKFNGRSILYQSAMTDLFVPYQDPNPVSVWNLVE
jgi:primary-amine oxidase